MNENEIFQHEKIDVTIELQLNFTLNHVNKKIKLSLFLYLCLEVLGKLEKNISK